jgi:hypothetical protein
MARYIYCKTCFERFRDEHPGDVSHYPDEVVRTMRGIALFDMRCDHCDKAIELGDWCGAVTMEKKNRQGLKWEHDFIVRHE